MKRVSLVVLALLATVPTLSEARSFILNPQIGLNATHFTSEPTDIESSSHMGYQIGGFVRIGKKAFLQPGAFYQRTGSKLTETQGTDIGAIKDNADITSFAIPVLVGVELVSKPAFTLRLNGGPVGSFVTSVKENEFGLTKDDYKSLIVGAIAGAGIDFGILTVDASYEFGLGKVFEDVAGIENKTKANVARLSVGIKI